MKYEIILCRQESFVIEADNEEEAEDIALDNCDMIDFDNREDKRILDYDPEELTKIITNEIE